MNKNNFKLPASLGCRTQWRQTFILEACSAYVSSNPATTKKGYCICVSNCTYSTQCAVYCIRKNIVLPFQPNIAFIILLFERVKELFLAVKLNQLYITETLTKTSCQSKFF